MRQQLQAGAVSTHQKSGTTAAWTIVHRIILPECRDGDRHQSDGMDRDRLDLRRTHICRMCG